MTKFKDILINYEHNLDYYKRMLDPHNLEMYHKTSEYWEGFKYASFKAFQEAKEFCSDGYPEIKYKLTKKDINILSLKNHELCGKLNYRGYLVPVFIKQWQSIYIIFKDKVIPSGSYSAWANRDFAFAIDKIIDEIKF